MPDDLEERAAPGIGAASPGWGGKDMGLAGWPVSPGSPRRAPQPCSELESALLSAAGMGQRSAERDAVLARVRRQGERGRKDELG